MCGIDWCGFTWQAFATLATGFAAVGGAIFVGLRQHALTKEQAEIARSQAEIAKQASQTARLKLRSDLFEQRMQVYLVVRGYLQAATSKSFDDLMELTPNLMAQLERARFLFARRVTEELDRLIESADELSVLQEEVRNAHQHSPTEAKPKAANLRDMRVRFRADMSRLAETMGEEMVLYVEPQNQDPAATASAD